MQKQVLLSMPIEEFKRIVESCVKSTVEKIVENQKFEKLLNIEEVTGIFKISRVTLYSWRKKDIIPSFEVGNRVYFKYSDILRSMETIQSKARKKN